MVMELEPSVRVSFSAGAGMAALPRYQVAGLNVEAGKRSRAGHDGSSVYNGKRDPLALKLRNMEDGWPDEFGFCRECLQLVRLDLKIPEMPEADVERVGRWLAVEPVSGAIYLDEPIADYAIMAGWTRWCSDREMVVFRPVGERPGAGRLRAEVAPGLQLLFADGSYAGWILNDPERCITIVDGDRSTRLPDPALARILRDYLNKMAVPELTDLLIDQDPGFRRYLEDTVHSIRLDEGAVDRRAILRDSIIDIIDTQFDS